MRLTAAQQNDIKRIVGDSIHQQVRLWLFGSRLDRSAIGGDIDLLLETPSCLSLKKKIALHAKLENSLGIPVDLITTSPDEPNRAIVNIARLTGVSL